MSFLQRFTTSPFRLVLLMGTICYSALEAFLFFRPTEDYVALLNLTRNFLQGEGLVSFQAMAVLSDLTPEKQFLWPPGYNLALAPFLMVFKNDVLAMILLTVLGTAIYYTSWFTILESLGDIIRPAIRTVVWLYWFLIHPPIYKLDGSDLLSLWAFMAAIAMTIWLIKSQSRSLLIGGLIGLLIGISILSRNAYWPLTPVIPGILLCVSIQHDRKMVPVILLMFLTAAACWGALSIWMVTTRGQLTFLSRMFGDTPLYGYWENLKSFYPFPVESIGFRQSFDFVYWDLAFRKVFDLSSFTGIWSAAAILLSLAYGLYFRATTSFFGNRSDTAARRAMTFFNLTGLSAVLITVAMLIFLSIKYPGCTKGVAYTHVQEPRYYVIAYAFLSVGCIWALMVRPVIINRWVSRFFYGMVGVIFFVSLSQAYLRPRALLRASVDYRQKMTIPDFTRDEGRFVNILKKRLPSNFKSVVVYGGEPINWLWVTTAEYVGANPFYYWQPGYKLSTEDPINLFIVWPLDETNKVAADLKQFCRENNGEKLGTIRSTYGRKEWFEVCHLVLHPEASIK